IVVVDDFHRLESGVRAMLIDYLKYLADYELSDRKLVIVGIPETGHKLAQVSFDIATRIQIFKFGKVSDSLIIEMIRKGEQALNIKFRQKTEIATAAAGSLNVAQMLCYYITVQDGIEKTVPTTRRVETDLEKAIARVMDQMELKFSQVIHSFAWLGGHKDHTTIELLQELARTPDGYLPLIPFKDTRPDLAKGIDRLIKTNAMSQFRQVCPDGEKHLLLDESTPAIFIDDPQLTFYLLQTPPSKLAKETGKSAALLRNRVFVSYSHADESWLERLRTHLKPLERDGLIDLWADTRIQAGALWRDEIKQAIDSAKVALLLISASFLASDFIANEELPPLLERATKEGVVVIPIILSPSLFPGTISLSQFQAINAPSKPLSKLDWNEQEEVLVKVAQATIDAIEY
ncbi:MAG TPA: toll/interleukin-1 receptor domain-containing protein, partial [Anaerolineales bacterium]|nr:toll/interleukin-1 receptor domain-containing protein [Anaerolineales bacterium]